MTLDQYSRAALARFAFIEASHTGSLAAMKGVCHVIRNRVRAGWNDSSWVAAIELATLQAGHDPSTPPTIDINNRLFQMILRDVDDIYYATSSDETEAVVGECLYYHFIDREPRQWFTDKIIRDPENHPRRAHIATVVFYE